MDILWQEMNFGQVLQKKISNKNELLTHFTLQ